MIQFNHLTFKQMESDPVQLIENGIEAKQMSITLAANCCHVELFVSNNCKMLKNEFWMDMAIDLLDNIVTTQ